MKNVHIGDIIVIEDDFHLVLGELVGLSEPAELFVARRVPFGKTFTPNFSNTSLFSCKQYRGIWI